MRLAGLLLVDEFLAPLLPCFLDILGQKQLLDNHKALQSQVPHGPWVHLMMPCQLPDASLRIFSHSRLDHSNGGGSLYHSLTFAPQPCHEVLAVILQLFDL
jgi:hypothetical protein